MHRFLARRILSLLPVLVVVGFVSFSLVHLIPGDPAYAILGSEATEDQIQELREALGLNRPFLVQMAAWFSHIVVGDLGESLYYKMPVSQVILQRLEPTVVLGLLALLIAMGLGIQLGVYAAVKHDTLADHGVMAIAMVGLSTPNFWLGLGLMLLFAVRLGILPTCGYVGLSENPLATIKHLLMPALAMGFSQSALIARTTRSSVLETLSQDFVRTARAKGLAERIVLYRHVLRNAMIPIMTVVGLTLAGLAGGAVVAETVFALPGTGRLMVDSVKRRDYPVIQATILLAALLYVVVNLLVDVLYTLVDPRVRHD
ncbi:MAG: ABC transporter permease [Bacillota bacterium]|nr:ABC transporter permease [Bacillota bacterium]